MFDELVDRNDWANYHHKKVTIGKMIEFLGGVNIDKDLVSGHWRVDDKYIENELVDALWKAVKEIS